MTPNIKQIIAEMREEVNEFDRNDDAIDDSTLKANEQYFYAAELNDKKRAILDYIEGLENKVLSLQSDLDFDPEAEINKNLNKLGW